MNPAIGGFRAFLRGESGSGPVELAFVTPVLMLLIVGIFEIGMALFSNALVEGAVRDASRFGITGQTAEGVSRDDAIRARIDEATLGLVDVGPEDISILVYPSFEDIGKPEPFSDDNGNGIRDSGEIYTDINGNGTWDADMGTSGAGGPGDVVIYRIEFIWPLMTGLLDFAMGGDLGMTASIAVRNEPYPAAGSEL